ncbi:uncharacterized protein LOC116620781 [Nematostella vectensis]|uniref:uncharacterized protein LOC116620781 n=1 Tax=Nematostella vectensis TaxID=45351 RepID=UPI0020774074|nr:uncharacterized protein LOC116620781 [Nematostella vectensis]
MNISAGKKSAKLWLYTARKLQKIKSSQLRRGTTSLLNLYKNYHYNKLNNMTEFLSCICTLLDSPVPNVRCEAAGLLAELKAFDRHALHVSKAVYLSLVMDDIPDTVKQVAIIRLTRL